MLRKVKRLIETRSTAALLKLDSSLRPQKGEI